MAVVYKELHKSLPALRRCFSSLLIGAFICFAPGIVVGLDSEVEPNDTTAEAQTIVSGDSVNGALADDSDDDYYALVVEAAGTLTVRIDTAAVQAYGWTLSVINTQGDVFGQQGAQIHLYTPP